MYSTCQADVADKCNLAPDISSYCHKRKVELSEYDYPQDTRPDRGPIDPLTLYTFAPEELESLDRIHVHAPDPAYLTGPNPSTSP